MVRGDALVTTSQSWGSALLGTKATHRSKCLALWHILDKEGNMWLEHEPLAPKGQHYPVFTVVYEGVEHFANEHCEGGGGSVLAGF